MRATLPHELGGGAAKETHALSNLLLAPFALLCGIVLTTQIATNKQLGEHLQNLYVPAAVNMVIGLVATTALTWVMTANTGAASWPSREMIRSAPPWLWLAGGVLGTVYLTGNILLAPKLGAAALVGLVVCGQLLFSVLLDHFGWLGFEQHTASLWRLLGCALLVSGTVLISRF